MLNVAVGEGSRSRPPATLDELVLFGDAPQACQALRRAGFVLVVVTNQPDVARGTQTRANVEAIHTVIRSRLPVHDIRVCFHDDADRCACRKPKPGMVLAAAADWRVDLARSFLIGDRETDVEAGRRAGCRTVLVGPLRRPPLASPDYVATSLSSAAHWILNGT